MKLVVHSIFLKNHLFPSSCTLTVLGFFQLSISYIDFGLEFMYFFMFIFGTFHLAL